MNKISVLDVDDDMQTWKSKYTSFIEKKWFQAHFSSVTKKKNDIYYCTVENDDF